MPAKSPKIFPDEALVLAALGERLRLARKRRKFTQALVAERSAISRATLCRVEKGDPAVTLGVYVRILGALDLKSDIALLAAEDSLGRHLQDSRLPRRSASIPISRSPITS